MAGRDAAAAAGLDPAILDRPSATLSKGTLQRVALLDALHANAPVLLLDEPFSGLDAAARDWLAHSLQERLDGGAAALLTDHDGATEGRLRPRTFQLGGAAPASPITTTIVATHPDGRRTDERVAATAVDARLRALLDDGGHIERVAP